VSGCKYGPDGKCGRKIAARGMCHSHRRRWLAGKPPDTPIRGYRRYEEGPDGKTLPIPPDRSSSPPSSKPRRDPFAKERALLKSLGLR
jgi:hypothetical protein